jgi:hypothetical protein
MSEPTSEPTPEPIGDSAKDSAGERASQQPEAAKSPATEPTSAGESASAGEASSQQNAEGKVAASKAAAGAASVSKLPVVWSPNLGAPDHIADDFFDFGVNEPGGTESAASAADETAKKDKAETSGAPAGDMSASRSLRFALLAASVAAAAGLGSFVGSSGVAQFWPAAPASASAGVATSGPQQSAKVELAELAALKANLDGASRSANGQLAKLAERLDRIEHVQADPAAKLAHIIETLERLEKKNVVASAAPPAAPETTGSIAGAPGAAAVAIPAEAKLPDKILQDWVIQDVRSGRALIQSRYGGIFDVTTGSILPGLGRIETIKRQDGQWIVVTARGLITEH